MIPRYLFLVVGVLAVGYSGESVWAQRSARDAGIRTDAEQILGEPEFQYFEHLNDSADRSSSRRHRQSLPFGSGKGDSVEGDGKPGGEGGTDEGRRAPNRNRPRPKRSDTSQPSSPDDDVTQPSINLGQGWGAIGGVFGLIFHALAYLILIAVCGLIVFLVIQAILNRESSSPAQLTSQMNFDIPQDEDHSPGELPADAYLAKARELAQQRRYREAIAQLLLGGMSNIERAELIRYRRGLTLRDYLRALRGRELQYEGFRALIGLYEPVGFGRRTASFQTFEDALTGYEQAVV